MMSTLMGLTELELTGPVLRRTMETHADPALRHTCNRGRAGLQTIASF